MPDIAALAVVDSGLLGLLTNVIELQLFHLLRAQAITREMRARIGLKQQQVQEQQHEQQPVPGLATRMCLEGAGSGTSSSDSCSVCDDNTGYLE